MSAQSNAVRMNRTALILALILAVITDALIIFFPNGSANLAADYRVFWLAARAPLTQLYAPSATPFINPPTALLLFKPLAMIGFWPGYLLWITVSLVLFCAAAMRAFPRTAVVMALLSPLILRCILLGQTPLLLSAAILSGFMRRDFLGGLLIGLAATIKPQLLLLAPLAFLVRRDWPLLIGSIVGAALSLTVTLALFGWTPWFDWLHAFPAFHDALVRTHVLPNTASPASYAESFGLNPVPFLGLGILVGAITVLTRSRDAQPPMLAAIVVGSSAIASPYALPHDLVLLAPAAAALLLSARRSSAVVAMLIFAGYLLPILLPAAALLWACEYLYARRKADEGTSCSS